MTTATTTAPADHPVERFQRPPRVSHTIHMREFTMPDGRKLLVDRRAIGFLCEAKAEDFGGKETTVVGFKTQAKACPVKASYADLRGWWFGAETVSTSKAA